MHSLNNLCLAFGIPSLLGQNGAIYFFLITPDLFFCVLHYHLLNIFQCVICFSWRCQDLDIPFAPTAGISQINPEMEDSWGANP